MRPIGIPTFTDKLVQEVLRIVLQSLYESLFLDCSHGFRPEKSCHTALKTITKGFNGTRWFIEGDIKGCFDNIDHVRLVEIIDRKIKDARLIKLIWKFLKAGYMENWQYHNTHSGTPQGGIVSPLFANIYLHELDKFVQKLATEFDQPMQQKYTDEYNAVLRTMGRLRWRLDHSTGEARERFLEEYREAKKLLLKTPSKSQTDKKIKYVRYADDFLIGVNGSREDCERIKRQLSDFIAQSLKMELSDEKTLIMHSENYARFLGYDIKVRRSGEIKRQGKFTARTLSGSVELAIPLEEKVMRFLFTNNIIAQQPNGKIDPVSRKSLLRLTDLEILTVFNAELRGICNYYSMASNFSKLNYFTYLMEYSCLKTLANKHKSTISKIIEANQDGMGKWGIPYQTKNGAKRRYFASYKECKCSKYMQDVFPDIVVIYKNSGTTFEQYLAAKACELCGATSAEHYEIHHVHKVKDLKGRERWEQVMIAKRRKTIVLCRECHKQIHGKRVSDD